MLLRNHKRESQFQQLRDTTHTIDPGVLCIQETWDKNDNTDYSIRGYHPPLFQVRKSKIWVQEGGGVAILIREDINFTRIKSPFIEKEIETLAIQIPSHNLIVINVHRGFGDVNKAVENLGKWPMSRCMTATGKKNPQHILHDSRLMISKKTPETEKSPWDYRDLECLNTLSLSFIKLPIFMVHSP